MHEGKAQEDNFRNICAIILNLKAREIKIKLKDIQKKLKLS